MKKRESRRPRQQRSRETRERLLDGALECLIERGYAGTTTTAVCEQSGVSRGGQQHHFPLREQLIVSAVEHLTARMIAAIRQAANDLSPEEDPVEATLELIWNGFSGRWFAAAYELWVAARTREPLRAVFVPAEHRASMAILELCMELFPPEVTQRKNFALDLSCVISMLHGLALTQIIRTDPELERYTLSVGRDILIGKTKRGKS